MSDQTSKYARQLALDPSISDYECWRMLKSVRYEIYGLERRGEPIPIRLLYARKTLEMALARRGAEA
jgi:hypothetical protein